MCREISFQFRTRLPHGLLVYHNVKNPDGIELDPYALYVIVEQGQLKVVHVFGKHSTSVTVGEGLNRDEWHSVMVSVVCWVGEKWVVESWMRRWAMGHTMSSAEGIRRGT